MRNIPPFGRCKQPQQALTIGRFFFSTMETSIKKQEQDFVFYEGNNGKVKIAVLVDNINDTIWMTQKAMAELFGVDVRTVNYHLQEIFKTQELEESSVIQKNRITAADGKNYLTNLYNLDAVIAVGYRVNSYQATQFRIWATKVLKDYLIKGFALDDDRLKGKDKLFGKDRLKELLERIQEIRASERVFYEKITDIFRDCSIDYDPSSPITQEFYAKMQNKFHYAIHQHTAPELLMRADANKENMGLTTWQNQKKGGKIYKRDVTNGKNYLQEDELKALNKLVNMFLDYAERLAEKGKGTYTMADWSSRLDMFLNFNEYPILENAGKVKRIIAEKFAESEYLKYRVIQDREYKSDFNRFIEATEKRLSEQSK